MCIADRHLDAEYRSILVGPSIDTLTVEIEYCYNDPIPSDDVVFFICGYPDRSILKTQNFDIHTDQHVAVGYRPGNPHLL